MRRGRWHVFLVVALVLGACGDNLRQRARDDAPPAADAPSAQDAPADGPTSDGATADGPETDAPPTDAPATDAPATDAPATDAPVADAPPDAPDVLGVPTNVVASDGTSIDVVIVTWTAVPTATGYRVWRDGAVIASVTSSSYVDPSATGATISVPVASASSGTFVDRVELSWTPATITPPATHLYAVTALRGAEESAMSATDAGSRATPQLLHYDVVTTSGHSFTTTQTSFADTTAPAGTITPGIVTASDGTFDARIAVTVTGASGADGAIVSYVVRAVTTGGTVSSDPVEGHRGIGPLTFAWNREDYGEVSGSFRSLRATTTGASFDDTEVVSVELHAYDCTVSAAGAQDQPTNRDLGWRANRPSETPRLDTWITNKPVDAVAVANDTIYVGGSFDYVGPPSGAFATIDPTTGVASSLPGRIQPIPNGLGVRTAIPDGAGGWYVAGDFAAISGVPQPRLARVTASGQLDRTFAPFVLDNAVTSLALTGNTLFIAGTFTSVNWRPGVGFAALDATTGALRPFSPTIVGPTPGPSGTLRTVAVHDNVLFIGGSYISIDGVARNGIAAFDLATETVTSWDAHANASAVDIAALTSDTLYVTGTFDHIGGQPRATIAALDVTTGAVTPFDPHPNDPGFVRTLVPNGNTVFVAGSFTTIGGQQRDGLALLDAHTGAALDFQVPPFGPSPRSAVALAVVGNTLYVGGGFASIGAAQRRNLAAFDATTGALLDWAPQASDTVLFIAPANGTLFVGGRFSSVGGRTTTGLAALDRTTGVFTSWDPGVDGPVRTLALAGDALFVGGDFSRIGGQSRSRLARIDRVTAAADAWTADANDTVRDLVRSGTTLYVAGGFTTISGQPRSRLAAVDVGSAFVSSWDPNPNGTVDRIALNDGTLYLAGSLVGFTSIGGQPRRALAAVDATTGAVTSFNPTTDTDVADLAVASGALYVAGPFTKMNGQPRISLASFDLGTGALSSWTTPITSSLGGNAIGVAGGTVYAGGQFVLPSSPFLRLAVAFDGTSGASAPWLPRWGGIPTRFATSGTSLITVGRLTHVAGYPRTGIAIFDP